MQFSKLRNRGATDDFVRSVATWQKIAKYNQRIHTSRELTVIKTVKIDFVGLYTVAGVETDDKVVEFDSLFTLTTWRQRMYSIDKFNWAVVAERSYVRHDRVRTTLIVNKA